MVNLKDKPFNLDEEATAWVENTLATMTLEEKIGQLFVPISYSSTPEALQHTLLDYGVGGVLYRSGKSEEMQACHRWLQEHSKIPLLIAANLEAGGDGIATDGTTFGKQMQVAATGDSEQAYRLGKISCSEGKAVGCNWAFAPVVDIDRNWRNPITNVRTYGDDPDMVLAGGKAYMRAAREENVAVSIKHFPGDGCDEVDQHILVSVNGLSCEEWDRTYGKVYQGLINDGALTVMVGHIAQPAYQRHFNPDFPQKLVPATLSPELLQGLLRGKLGFNGLITTDSTCMVGFNVVMPRAKAIPYAIEAGCDTILFNKDLDEDYHFMLDGYKSGILSDTRLTEAVTRILATKAALGLHKQAPADRVPPAEALAVLRDPTHRTWAEDCADKAVTLVKDTAGNLPLRPEKTRRILLEVLGNYPSTPRVQATWTKCLEEAGFTVIPYEKENFETAKFDVRTFHENYDMVLYIGNMENASNQVTNRYQWFTFFGNGNNCPWFTAEVPVVYVSMANPYALVDVPQIQTYINCYSNHDAMIHACADKLLGHSPFLGKNPIDPFCGKEYLAY